MKNKFIIGSLLVILLSGCVSSKFTNTVESYELNSESSYLGLYVTSTYQIGLKNLDTNEIINLNVKKDDPSLLKVIKLPEGDYAITYIKRYFGLFGSKSLKMPVPYDMKTIIEARNNSIIYIGNLNTTVKNLFNSSVHTLHFDYTVDEVTNEIKENYYFSDNFKVNTIHYLTIATKDESTFKF